MDIIGLVEQCKSGDKDAFGLLYQTYLPAMRKIVAYYIHNSDTVWDILHDGFLIAFSSIGSLNNNERVEAWLTTLMKNLSLKYLKEESSRQSLPMSGVEVPDNTTDTSDRVDAMTWEELNEIINQLPEGYGKVFRLAVLDGLSHKEISVLLGIAPHSSSSQLSHAKSMLRRLIVEYRMGIGVISLVTLIAFIRYEINNNKESIQTSIASSNADNSTMTTVDVIDEQNIKIKPINTQAKSILIHKRHQNQQSNYNPVEVAEHKDIVPEYVNGCVSGDTIMNNTIDTDIFIVRKKNQQLPISVASEWSFALTYSGNSGQSDNRNYRTPNPNLPDVESSEDEIEVIEKVHHHMPVVIGMSINKAISSRWSFETGIRYTYLRSDLISDSKLNHSERIQRIHYVGVPIKFDYRIFSYKGLSLYGHGGGALDIPVKGRQSVLEYSQQHAHTPNTIVNINAPLQWSVEGGIGLQYHMTPSFSVYAEPSLHYYFNTKSEIQTIRQNKPIEFTIPIGLRLTW